MSLTRRHLLLGAALQALTQETKFSTDVKVVKVQTEDTVKQLLRKDGNFQGDGPEARQVGVVSVDERAFVYTVKKQLKPAYAS